MNNNFFNILSDILTKKSGGTLCDSEEFKTEFSSFMLVRYLSMKDNLLPYANILNRIHLSLTPEQVYKWAYNTIPKQRSGFIKYISKPKKKKKK